VSPVGEVGDYKEGVSLAAVPDMGAVGGGVQTLFYPNQQSSRLMFYHDHAYGITRLNVYAGEAAGYLVHDAEEDALIGNGTLPNLGGVYQLGVPLIIQDKTFVHPGTLLTDPTWANVAPGGAAVTGNLWFPHVYVPNQDPYHYYSTTDAAGMNAMGRWDYGPWIWPPVTVQVPDTLPNPSIVPEAFMDTMVVNGKAFPYFDVQRRAYRFRILNASNDRFMNLQLYFAYDAASAKVCDGTQNKNKATCTEVLMVPRNGATYTYTAPGETVATTSIVPDDGFRGSVPDPRTSGPKVVQIGNEGGFLPAPVVRNLPPVPITYDTDPKSMTVGNVKAGTIILGPAERADVVIDFSRVPDGARLILYNDAPAAFPAGDKRYDYFTGNEDLTANGGAPSTTAGKGPNTRTIMQFRVAGTQQPAFNFANLMTAMPIAYAKSQDAPHVPQPEYPQTPAAGNQYATLFNTTDFTFVDGAGNTQTLPIHQKAIAEEFDSAYGRMSAVLGTEAMVTGNQGQNTFGFFYVDPSTENLPAGVTQIWKITHNGVDTHAIHWHLLNVQVINRVDWAGVIKAPDPDELGWKETVRMNPLEDIIVAVQAKAPALPSTWAPLPDSVRPRDVTQPLGSMMSFTQPWPYDHTPANQQPIEFPVQAVNPANTTNEMTNFGWEYVWHCHLLGHEENDMMRPLVMTQVSSALDTIAPVASAALSPAPNAAGWNKAPSVSLVLTATDTGGSGVKSIEYSTDLGTTWLPYSAPVAFGTETSLAGSVVQSRATDVAGNVSLVVSTTFKLDLTAPTFTQAPIVTKVNTNSVTITGKATDALSGLVTGAGAGTYSITGGPSSSAGTFSIAADGSFSFGRTKMKNGNYTATVIVKDAAGNVQTTTVGFTIP
jgi:FtsP/CotA-like multicopper oxidase with cupredoxin domain